MFTKSSFGISSALVFAVGTSQLLGCGGPALVQGNAQVENLSQTLLIKSAIGVRGTYVAGTCIDPAGTGGAKRGSVAWEASFGPNPGQPVVVQNDPGCQLNITGLDIVDSGNQSVTAVATTPVGLAATYGQPVLFTYTDSGSGQPANFYANGILTPANFSASFTINVVYSDTRTAVSPTTLNASYATVVPTTITSTSVPAPNYQLGFTGVTYTKDRNNVVVSVNAGAPTLTPGNQVGQNYVITNSACPATLPLVNAAYTGGTQVAVATPPTSASFGLVAGLGLSAQRCMVIANCANAVCSYQLFQVTLN